MFKYLTLDHYVILCGLILNKSKHGNKIHEEQDGYLAKSLYNNFYIKIK